MGLVLSIVLQAQATAPQAPAKAPRAATPARQSPQPQPPAAVRPSPPPAGALKAQEHTALLKRYCIGCHSERGKAGGLSLVDFDVAKASSHTDIAEKMIRKLRAGMMPPAGARRPDEATLAALVADLETRVDAAVEGNLDPGSRPFQRLNRAEYQRAVRDLLDLNVDVTPFLPADSISNGFDNVADAQSFSPTLMEGYLRAASRITALAAGDATAPASESNYKPPKTASQLRRVEGAPVGTRGGISVMHTFPADGDYIFRMDLMSNACGVLFGGTADGEQLEVSVDGERVALIVINPKMIESTTGVTLKTEPIHLTAGSKRVTAAFVQQAEGPVIDLIAPIEHTLADTQIGVDFGITTVPHLKDMSIVGPYRVSGVSDTASRRKLFSCRPTSSSEEATCAASIIKRLATDAFRRPVASRDLTSLMKFYDAAREEGGFEAGVAATLEAILTSPQFLFRLEPVPTTVSPSGTHRIGDAELASRLSFFLWGTSPDTELRARATDRSLRVAGENRPPDAADVARQPRRGAGVTVCVAVAASAGHRRDPARRAPLSVLRQHAGKAFRRETELFFESLVGEDRSVLELLTADYTFVNERIAKHYGIPNVMGTDSARSPARLPARAFSAMAACSCSPQWPIGRRR